MAKRKLTKAEREEMEARHAQMEINVRRTRALAEKAQAELDEKRAATQSFVFVAEPTQPGRAESAVRFRYVVDDVAELSIPRAWWDELGGPERIEVAVSPQRA